MSALQRLSHYLGVNLRQFSREENLFLEAELFLRISEEIWAQFKLENKDYFHHLTNFNVEHTLMELQVIRCLIDDILRSENYTLSGIAYYTQTPEELVQELLIGYRVSPVITFTRKLIELHKEIKPDLYKNVIKKIGEAQEEDI